MEGTLRLQVQNVILRAQIVEGVNIEVVPYTQRYGFIGFAYVPAISC